MSMRFILVPSEDVIGWQAAGVDSQGRPAKQKISDGDGCPCRHCQENIGKGDPYLVLAHRPFSGLHAYAETGPIFVHAAACRRAESGDTLPAIFNSAGYILRGYDNGEIIVYGTGGLLTGQRPFWRIRQLRLSMHDQRRTTVSIGGLNGLAPDHLIKTR